jgi:hypothetical protein
MPTYGELLAIADDLVARGQEALPRIEARLQDYEPELTILDKVVGGLVLKIQACFEALFEDAREGRGEAMHHLKTMCEAFIYLYEAGASEERATLVLANAYHQRFKRGDDSRLPDPELAETAKARRDALLGGHRLPEYITHVDQVADKHGPHLPRWYAGVYRLACEPAHISDLEDFSPASGALPKADSPARLHRAYQAMYHGIAIMLAVAEFWTAKNRLGSRVEVHDLRARFEGKVSQ